MSMEALVWAARQPVTPVSRKYVLSTLADKANAAGECWPTIAAICEVTGLKERMVRRHIAALARDGYLSSENRGRQSNLFKLHLSGTPVPVNAGTPVPDNEIDNRYSSTEDLEPLTGTPVQLNRYSSTATSLLTQKNPKGKDSSRPPTRARESPAWLKRLSLDAWKKLTALHVSELEEQAQRLGVDIAAESLACEDWMKSNRRVVKAPYATLKNWLDKAAQIKGERSGDNRTNSQAGDSKPGADGGGNRSSWATAIRTGGRQTGVA